MGIAKILMDNYEREKARLSGKAKSQARMIKAAKDIPGLAGKLAALEGPGGAQPIQGAGVRMMDGKPMVFYTDGSLRHALGKRVTKAARKELKRARRAELNRATKKSS